MGEAHRHHQFGKRASTRLQNVESSVRSTAPSEVNSQINRRANLRYSGAKLTRRFERSAVAFCHAAISSSANDSLSMRLSGANPCLDKELQQAEDTAAVRKRGRSPERRLDSKRLPRTTVAMTSANA